MKSVLKDDTQPFYLNQENEETLSRALQPFRVIPLNPSIDIKLFLRRNNSKSRWSADRVNPVFAANDVREH